MNVHIDSFDPETVTLMSAALDRAWSSLPPERQTPQTKSMLATAIVRLASQGERDAVRLSHGAFDAIRTEGTRDAASADTQIEGAG
jgi:hypothetical protein